MHELFIAAGIVDYAFEFDFEEAVNGFVLEKTDVKLSKVFCRTRCNFCQCEFADSNRHIH